jgi:hypothetical protein
MATDDAHQAAEAVEFRQKLDAMVAVTNDTKKKYDTACVRVLAATAVLASRAAPSDDDYEAAVIANIHVQAIDIQNIRSHVSVTLYLFSTHYARWRDNVLLTLMRYSLSYHVLLDTTSAGVPACDQMDSVVKLGIWGTISPD